MENKIYDADYDTVIIGGGSAGLSAAIYARRAELSTLVIEKDNAPSGQIAVTERVDNYPGMFGVSGFELAESFHKHAAELGAEFLTGEVRRLEQDQKNWNVILADGNSVISKTVIYAAGTSHRKLGVPGGDKKRISYCAVCDGFFYKEKTAAVIGGGDTALSDALYLAKLAEKVYLIHRRDEFRANKLLQKRVSETPNIIPIMNAVISEITGGEKAEGLIYTQNGVSKSLEIDGIFAAIGSVPNSDPMRGICVLDGSGYVIAGEDCVTGAKGIFAAGDVRTTPLRQVVTAAADGANAAVSAESYISSQT